MFTIETFTFNAFLENTYVLYNEKGQAIIIDPGTYFPAEFQTLKDYILRAGLKPELLLNTHCHLDHIFGNRSVCETYKLVPKIHPLEEQLHQMGAVYGQEYGLPFEPYTGSFEWLQEGERVTLGADQLQILLLPGHSPGSLGFYCREQGFIIGGDVLFKDGIGRTDLPKGDESQLLHSIKEKLFNLPAQTVVYPGHGPKTTIGYEMVHNPFL